MGEFFDFLVIVQNPASETSFVKRAYSSCSCLIAESLGKTLPPGSKGTVKMRFFYYPVFPDTVKKFLFIRDRSNRVYRFRLTAYKKVSLPVFILLTPSDVYIKNRTGNRIDLSILGIGHREFEKRHIRIDSKGVYTFSYHSGGQFKNEKKERPTFLVDINGEKYFINPKVSMSQKFR